MNSTANIAGRSVLKFGISAIIVGLCSACATGTPSRTAMTIEQLEYFQPNCKIAAQQIAMLNSMRRTDDDQLFSLSGWTGQDRKINWLINWHIRDLRDYC